MISSVYSYYLSQYGHRMNSKYDTHTKSQLKNTYSKVVKINSQTPVYKLDLSSAAQKYAIDLKENARALENITQDLSDNTGEMTFKKSAVSSNPSVISASYIGDSSLADDNETFDVDVKQLASTQINTGHYLQPRSKMIQPGDYSFDLTINNLTYEFQFTVENNETVNNIQNKLARLINRSNIGLTADIKEDNLGNTAINIESDATGVGASSPVIFLIEPSGASNSNNNDSSLTNTAGIPGSNNSNNNNNNAANKNAVMIDTLGLDRVAQYPSNAIFAVNNEERASATNSVTINQSYALEFTDTTDKPVTISLKADADSIAESISELVSGYNNLISVAGDKDNSRFQGTERLYKEITSIARSHKKQLESNGLTLNNDGTISTDKEILSEAADNNKLSSVFESLNSFKDSIRSKAENIALNPMDYVNNKIIAYKNPTRTYNDPYNLSAYTGMMFNGYI